MKKIEYSIAEPLPESGMASQNRSLNVNGSINGILQKDFVNMKDIQEQITPIITDCDIFISYSHDEDRIAKSVANRLMIEGYKVFIDSLFWGSIDDALRKYDDQKKGSEKYYNYTDRNKSTSTFHMILVDSIIDTINNRKVFLFLHGNSNVSSNTLSPWLYLENKIANQKSNELPVSRFESYAKIQFPIDTDDFYKVSNINMLLDALKSPRRA